MARRAAVKVCDSCTDVVLEEAGDMGLELEWEQAQDFARTMGMEVPDHCCDARDVGETCGCACRGYDTPRRPSLVTDIQDGLATL